MQRPCALNRREKSYFLVFFAGFAAVFLDVPHAPFDLQAMVVLLALIFSSQYHTVFLLSTVAEKRIDCIE